MQLQSTGGPSLYRKIPKFGHLFNFKYLLNIKNFFQSLAPRYPEGLARSHPGREVPVVPFGWGCGITALGVPIDAPKGAPGRDPTVAPECLRRWEQAVEQTCLILERLRAYPEGQVRKDLLQYSLDACRVVHLLRSTELEDAGQSPAVLRAKLQEATQDLLGTGLSEDALEQVCLPICL